MGFLAIPRGVKVVMEYTIDGGPVVNIFLVTTAGEVQIADLTDIINVFNDWHENHLSAIQSHNIVLDTIQATDVSVENGSQETVSNINRAGGASEDGIPINVAGVISWRTAKTGRSYRGRTYIGGLRTDQVSGQREMSTITATNLATAGGYLISGLHNAGYDLAVGSRWHNGVPRTTGVATPVIEAVVNTGLDTQRRRIKQ